ncbi:LysR family transcriptional regulator [Aliirhizobium smilacinae]|uniref:LysR family transcriptional regulator n=1 Tax=Aliirhizobium smilacinae TaxID=1395944 RepID=A0A5C4XMZ1_9HYPH|nr:LysR family transcriptional regulator [Rhizobium smilacinae]TNM63854.1 LysR family transcriptional regulator [Rhizobium smilacinae]
MSLPPSFRQVRAFLSLVQHLKFTRAAQELNVSQPTLTVQINQLEEQLGIKLFDRNKRRVELTPAGRNILPLMERLAINMDDILLAASDLTYARRGIVKIAALPSVAASFLPRAIMVFRQQNPGIEINVWDVVGEDIIKLVKAEEVDFGIGTRISSDRSIKVEDYVSDSLCAFFPVGHPLANAPPVLQISDFAPYPLVLTRKNSTVRVLFERSMDREGCEVSVAMEANYMSTALSMVRAGVGVAILPTSAVEAGNMTGLAYKLVEAPWFNRRVGIIRKADHSLQPVAQRFIETMHSMPDLRSDESFKSARRLDTVPARVAGPGMGKQDGLPASFPGGMARTDKVALAPME